MDRYETRRLALKALVDEMGRGGRTEVAKRIGKEASYVARLLYPPNKEGRKRIGDELLEALTRAYPDWLTREPTPGNAMEVATPKKATAPLLARATVRPAIDYVDFGAYKPPRSAGVLPRIDALPMVAERLELAAWEVQRKLGFMPAPGRIQLFTQHGPSMRPLLEDGDIAFIDTLATQFCGDDCYLIAMGGDIQVKLLQRRGADLWVVSQNTDFPPWRITDESDIIICGKAVMRTGLRSF